MLFIFILPYITCFSGDSEQIEVHLEALNSKVAPLSKYHNKSVDLTIEAMQTEQDVCGEVPGLCNENITDINIIINGTVEEIYVSVNNITVILLVCVILQSLTAAIIMKVIYCTKKRIRYNIGRRNKNVQERIFNPLVSAT